MKCPKCRRQMTVDEHFCSKCGADLSALRAICPNCGSKMSAGEKFCTRCGAGLEQEEGVYSQGELTKSLGSSKKGPRKSRIVLGTLIVVVLIAVAIAATALYENDKTAIDESTHPGTTEIPCVGDNCNFWDWLDITPSWAENQ